MTPPDPGYLTHQATVAVRGADSLFIRSLIDRQQYADPDGLASAAGFSEANWPLFGVVWPSGRHLAGFIERRAKPCAEVLIIDPDRGNRPPFVRRMAAMGFALTESRLSTPEDDGLPYKGRLLRFLRAPS